MKNYHCCATCTHFHVERTGPRMNIATCVRLGFETKSNYQFNCWTPRADIVEKMRKQAQSKAPGS